MNNNTIPFSKVEQNHSGLGDNVARDKIVNNYTGKSTDYDFLRKQIDQQKRFLGRIPDEEIQERLEASGELNALLEQEKQFKVEVYRLYEAFTRIELNTQRLQRAKQHFEDGEFTAARAVLDAEAMSNELEVLLEQKDQLEKTLHETNQHLADKASEFLILSRLQAINYELPDRFDKTKEYFEQSLKAKRSEENIFAYASFLQQHNDYNNAIILYVEALEIYRELAKDNFQTHSKKLVMTLTNLGVIHKNNKDFDESEKAYVEALDISKKLVEIDYQLHIKDLAIVLENLGVLHKNNKKYLQAENALGEALTIYRELATMDPEHHLSDVATTLINFGALYRVREEFAKAETVYTEAISILRGLINTEDRMCSLYLAKALSNFANVLEDTDDYIQAQEKANEALIIYKQLAQENPHMHLKDLARAIDNVALLNEKKGDSQIALEGYIESLIIRRILVQQNAKAHKLDLATTAANLSLFYLQSMPDKLQSLTYAKEALDNASPFVGLVDIASYEVDRVKMIINSWELDFENFCQSNYTA